MLEEFCRNELSRLEEQGLYRNLRTFSSPQVSRTLLDDKDVLLLASNSYLGICSDARLKEAAVHAIEKYGAGSGGSRLTTGNYKIHLELEEKIAGLKGCESAIVFNTGYMANIGVISALADRDSVVFCDKLNHASIIDGCRLSGAELVVFRHSDMDDLETKARKFKGRNGLIITDGIFSMDGDIAKIPGIVDIARKYGYSTLVDDAHATGVIGPNGGGTAEYYGIKDGVDVQIGTLSKAFAGEGGFAAGSKSLIDYLRNKARSFIYTTALSPQTAAVALKAIEIAESEPFRRQSLAENIDHFRNCMTSAGFNVADNGTPIIPIMAYDADKAMEWSRLLLAEGIYVPAIRPPTVKKGTSRLRVSLMAGHSKQELAWAAQMIKETSEKLGIG